MRSSRISEMDKVSSLLGSGFSGGFEIHKRCLFRKHPEKKEIPLSLDKQMIKTDQERRLELKET
ncbi:hypothetical protein DLM75_06450 [Leptospira stimsonii]|uniref:Uncharacterized protein n=1 Tax=Leptospira stimsonii TaxID=2202203 RepID=A0A396ZB22_9LEPT|nr:hypothetical protein DLM75_06450 [Leptospira stimsonii]